MTYRREEANPPDPAHPPQPPLADEPDDIEFNFVAIRLRFISDVTEAFNRLRNFQADPKDSVHMIFTKIDEDATACEQSGRTISREGALRFYNALPRAVKIEMDANYKVEEARRLAAGLPTMGRDQIRTIAAAAENTLQARTAEFRNFGLDPANNNVTNLILQPVARRVQILQGNSGQQQQQQSSGRQNSVPTRSNLPSGSTPSPTPSYSGRDDRACHTCGQTGHLMRHCPSKPTSSKVGHS